MAVMKKYLLPILVLFLAYYYSTNEEFRPGEYHCVSFGKNRLKTQGCWNVPKVLAILLIPTSLRKRKP